ncbi:MAG: ABC transporter permease subunit [Thermoplasmata archaeon]|nr:MAG: ABC transporter permease subunit [Thermoplasmata archaeon]
MMKGIKILIWVMAGIIIAFLFIPIVNLFIEVGFNGIAKAMADKAAMAAIATSFIAALFATLLSMAFGTPLAYLLARKNFYGKSFVESIVDLPVVIPHTVAGIALLLVLGRHGLLGQPLSYLGLRLTDTIFGVTLAMLFVSAPFFINQAREGFERVDPRMENVAMSLGASRLKAVMTTTLPISMRSIVTGAIMAWARSISEFGAVIIIAYFPMVAPTYIYSQYVERGVDYAAAPAALLLLICIAIFILLRLWAMRWRLYDKD